MSNAPTQRALTALPATRRIRHAFFALAFLLSTSYLASAQTTQHTQSDPVASAPAAPTDTTTTQPTEGEGENEAPVATTTSPTETVSAPKSILDRGQSLLDDVQRALAELVTRIEPAVVTIQSDRTPLSIAERSSPAGRVWLSTGTGVVIREDGMILTSQHVIDRASTIQVVMSDGRRFRALPIAEDRRADLAIIRIPEQHLKAAELAEENSVRRGNIVVAMGNPLGLSADGQASVSHGIVSAIGRPLPENFGRDEDRYYGDMIQTTAPINPGNSGGPLIDTHGRVIGVITAVSTRSDGHEGIGFAVPINAHTRSIIERLLRGQPIEYGYLGVEVEPLEGGGSASDLAARSDGVRVTTVFPGGPAERSGLRGRDIVTTVNGEPVYSVEHFVKIIGSLGPNRIAAITYLRDDKKRSINVTLTRRPSTESRELPDVKISFRGSELGTVKPTTRLIANLPENALLVLRVDSGTAAEKAGLTPGDVIVGIEGSPVSEKSLELLQDDGSDIVVDLANGGTTLVKSPRKIDSNS